MHVRLERNVCAALDYETGGCSIIIITHYRYRQTTPLLTLLLLLLCSHRNNTCSRVVSKKGLHGLDDPSTRKLKSKCSQIFFRCWIVWLMFRCYYKSDAIPNPPLHFNFQSYNIFRTTLRLSVLFRPTATSLFIFCPTTAAAGRSAQKNISNAETLIPLCCWAPMNGAHHLHLSHQFTERAAAVWVSVCVTVWAPWILCYCRDRMISYINVFIFVPFFAVVVRPQIKVPINSIRFQ